MKISKKCKFLDSIYDIFGDYENYGLYLDEKELKALIESIFSTIEKYGKI